VHKTFIFCLVTWTFQSIQNYLYKLSGKRLSGKRPLPGWLVSLTSLFSTNTAMSEISELTKTRHFKWKNIYGEGAQPLPLVDPIPYRQPSPLDAPLQNSSGIYAYELRNCLQQMTNDVAFFSSAARAIFLILVYVWTISSAGLMLRNIVDYLVHARRLFC